MINLNLNSDNTQKVQFSSVDALRKAIVSNPHRYDGLSLFVDNEIVADLVYVECYESWEVEVNNFSNEGSPFDVNPCDSIEEAVDEFVSALAEWGVVYLIN